MPKPVGYLALRKWIKEKNQNDDLTKKQVVQLENSIYHDLISMPDAKCEKCHRKDNLTLDHIVPKSILQCFGIDTMREIIDGNYQLLCKPCNIFKSGRLDFSKPVTKEILRKLLDRI